MTRAARRRDGVTLVEMMVTYGLLILVVGGAVWALVMSFRASRVIEGELDVLDRSLSVMTRVVAEAALSRGMVRFTPEGESDPKDGFQMRGSRIVVYERDTAGGLKRSVYEGPTFKLVEAVSSGKGLSALQVTPLERGARVKVETGPEQPSRGPLPPGRTLEMTTAVRAMYW